MPSVWPGLTDTNIRSDATDVHVRYPFLLNHLLKACFAQFSVIEKCGVRVNIWDNSFTDDLSGGMNLSWDLKYGGISPLTCDSAHLQVFMELGSPGLLDTVPRPQGLLHLGRSLEHHRVVHIALISLLDLGAITISQCDSVRGRPKFTLNYVINHPPDKNRMFPTLLSGWSFLRWTVSMKETWSYTKKINN